MRILLDERMPRKLKRDLPGHEVLTVPETGERYLDCGHYVPEEAPDEVYAAFVEFFGAGARRTTEAAMRAR